MFDGGSSPLGRVGQGERGADQLQQSSSCGGRECVAPRALITPVDSNCRSILVFDLPDAAHRGASAGNRCRTKTKMNVSIVIWDHASKARLDTRPLSHRGIGEACR